MHPIDFEKLVDHNQAKVDAEVNRRYNILEKGTSEFYNWALKEVEGKHICNEYPISVARKDWSVNFRINVGLESIWLGDVNVYIDDSRNFFKRLKHGDLGYCCGGDLYNIGYISTFSNIQKNLLRSFAKITRQDIQARLPKYPYINPGSNI